jgi:hypothetical protein
MQRIVDLFRRVWQSEQPATNTDQMRALDGADRSSMADFVRILRMHEEEQDSSSYSGRP